MTKHQLLDRIVRATIGLALIGGLGRAVLAGGEELKGVAEVILMQPTHVGQPSHAERLLSYLEATGGSIQELEEVLIAFVEEVCPEAGATRQSRFLCTRAVETLGDLRSERAIRFLKAVARTEDEILRSKSIRAIANVGSPGMLEFAGEVIANQQLYNHLDRYALYKTLVNNLNRVPDPKWSDIRPGVQRFLLEAVIGETDGGNVILIDRTLKETDMNYRMSYEREHVLEGIQASKVDKYRKYVAQELPALRRSPVTERTHVKIKNDD